MAKKLGRPVGNYPPGGSTHWRDAGATRMNPILKGRRMLVPVRCAECGELFEADPPASCPRCGARVSAKPEPLPLPEEVGRVPIAVQPMRQSRRWAALVAICALVAGATFLVQRYRGGAVPPFIMRECAAPDGSCRATLPGAAVPVESPRFSELETGASLFAAGSSFTRLTGGLGWIDLDPERAKMVRSDDLFANVRDELGRWLGEPEIQAQGAVKSGASEGVEVRFGKGTRRFTARMIFARGVPQPRLYLVWIGGPHFDPDGETAARVLVSFRIDGPAQ